MITCLVRYEIDPSKMPDFEHYARTWMRLIEKYGGTHHGYYKPSENPPNAEFSFTSLGRPGPNNIAIALFSFPTTEAYDAYRVSVLTDPQCIAETRLRDETRCFTSYERTFLEPIER